MGSLRTESTVVAHHHDYGWMERHVSLLVVAGWTLAYALTVSILMIRYQAIPPFEKQIGLWVMLLLGVAIGVSSCAGR